MEIVSSIVKDQLNRFIIEMGDSSMKKKTIIISGIAAVLVIGSVVFCFAVKGDGTQPAEVAQTVTEAVATPAIEIPEETSSEVSEPEGSSQSRSTRNLRRGFSYCRCSRNHRRGRGFGGIYSERGGFFRAGSRA